MLSQLKPKILRIAGPRSPRLITAYHDAKYRRRYTHEMFQNHLARMRGLAYSIDTVSYDDYVDVSSEVAPLGKLSSHAILEINNTCNIDCLMCKTSLATRKKGKIKHENLVAALDCLKQEGVTVVSLHTIGDPLANPSLEVVFKELRAHGMRAGISTNGLLLHRFTDMFPKYLDVCSLIRFSVDGASKETYEKIRFGGDWETLIENLDLAKNHLMPKSIITELAMVVSRDNLHEVGTYIEKFRGYVRKPVRDLSFNVINSLSPDTRYFDSVNLFPDHTHENKNCHYLSATTPFVHLDGEFSLCSRDYDGSLRIGNIIDKPIHEVRNGEKLDEMRRQYFSRNLDNLPQCANCTKVDERAGSVFSIFVKSLMYYYPDQDAAFYQQSVDKLVSILETRGEKTSLVAKLLDDVFP